VLLVAPALLAVTGGMPAQAAPRVGEFTVDLAPINKDGDGTVAITQRGTALTVHLQAAGLDGGVHLAHLHGVRSVQNSCPTLALDANGDGRVDIAEGLAAYGPVQVTLSHGTDDRGTSLDFTRIYKHRDNGDGIASLGDLDRYVIVVHGVDLDGDGLATNPDAQGDGSGDPDDNEISMPAFCGTVEAVR
jgi:hypothetical protein